MRVLPPIMAQVDTTSTQVDEMKAKPRLPRKPTHLKQRKSETPATGHRKISHHHTASAPPLVKEFDCEKFRGFKEESVPEKSSFLMKSIARRKSSGAVVSTKPLAKVSLSLRLRSSSSDSLAKNSWSSCETVYEDADYVEINLPDVAKGTLILTDKTSGKLEARLHHRPDEARSSDRERHSSNESVKPKPSKRHSGPQSHSAMVQELQRNFRSNSMDSLPQTKVSDPDTVDENGYEVPLAFKMPVYISFESEFMTSLSDNKEPSDIEQHVPDIKNIHKKKKRLARYKRKVLSSAKITEKLRSRDAEVLSSSFPTVKTPEVGQYDLTSGPSDRTREALKPKPIISFLSSRLREVKSDDHTGNTGSASLSNEYVISSTGSYSTSGDDEWSCSSSDESCGCECYYQQIDPPDLPDNPPDHDYEIIEEYMSLADNSKSAQRKKSVKSVVASMHRKRDKRTKSSDSNKSNSEIGVSPKLQRHNMQDMRTTDMASCTWETVSTPGILKLNEFKNFGRTKLSNGTFPEAR